MKNTWNFKLSQSRVHVKRGAAVIKIRTKNNVKEKFKNYFYIILGSNTTFAALAFRLLDEPHHTCALPGPEEQQ